MGDAALQGWARGWHESHLCSPFVPRRHEGVGKVDLVEAGGIFFCFINGDRHLYHLHKLSIYGDLPCEADEKTTLESYFTRLHKKYCSSVRFSKYLDLDFVMHLNI